MPVIRGNKSIKNNMKELAQNKERNEDTQSGKELYEAKKKQKEEEKKREQRKEVLSETPKKIGRYLLYSFIGAGVIGGLFWYLATRPPIPESDIVSKTGLHWHPELAMYVKGVTQEIPANIGIGAVHKPIHTHDASGTLHLEFQGLVRKQDITLGQFFKNWGTDMRSFGTNLKMTVNGKENAEYENYGMQDKDKIEIHYE